MIFMLDILGAVLEWQIGKGGIPFDRDIFVGWSWSWRRWGGRWMCLGGILRIARFRGGRIERRIVGATMAMAIGCTCTGMKRTRGIGDTFRDTCGLTGNIGIGVIGP